MEKWYGAVQRITESYLTRRKRKRELLRAKQKAKNPIVDWIEAFLWAAIVVLIINQYAAQAYQIPSGSMKNTLQITDRIFVNKMIYGPELVPGAVKLPGFTEPERDEIIIFESPTYISKGPLFDTLQRLIYMLTLSLVDIDKDENGNPRPHFLIKRAVGMERDRIRFVRGEVEIIPPGFETWISEAGFRQMAGLEDRTRRIIEPDTYPSIRASAWSDAYLSMNVNPPEELLAEGSRMPSVTDMFEWMKYRTEMLYRLNPQDRRVGGLWRKFDTGWYIGQGYILPLGDNRDNSRDGRYFGPVSLKKVLGRAMFIYWPFGRMGAIH
ncbi:MAG: signal peptidase I [Sediminispirochaetaceae bacterium]